MPNMRKDVPFGEYRLDMNKLADNVVSVQSATKHKIAHFPNAEVSDNLKAALLSLIAGSEPNVGKLTSGELSYLKKLINKSHADVELPDVQPQGDNHKLLLRMKILTGEIQAGNHNNPQIKKELTFIIQTMVKRGMITMQKAQEFARHWL